MKLFNVRLALTIFAASCMTAPALAAEAPPRLTVKEDGSIVMPDFDLPFSVHASREARDALVARLRAPVPPSGGQPGVPNSREGAEKIIRANFERYAARYPYTSTKSTIGNVPVETFVPKAGIAPENKDRILIQLHGGGYTSDGGGLFGPIETIPVAGIGRFKVIAVSYRLLPKNTMQDAIDDVVTVYRDVLKTYKPENIGIYGCSAGGGLTSMAVPAFIRQNLPVPGAIAILCSSIRGIGGGDSAQLWPRLGSVLRNVPPVPAEGAPPRAKEPFAPTQDELRKFPPTLLLTGTRAPEMSAAAQSNIELLSLGVDSRLVLFDGMDHGFFIFGSHFPESERANGFVARYFLDYLGGKQRTAKKP